MLGEIALYSFVVLLLSGTYLALYFDPSMVEVTYQGPSVPLRGIEMSQAFASTMNLSFVVRGGLFIRQIHHFTGAFRKPRETSWVIGVVLLIPGDPRGLRGLFPTR